MPFATEADFTARISFSSKAIECAHLNWNGFKGTICNDVCQSVSRGSAAQVLMTLS